VIPFLLGFFAAIGFIVTLALIWETFCD